MTAAEVGARTDPMLSMHGISKAFGGVAALIDVSLAVRRGTVHALVGENGAGKTTLMRIAFRMIAPDRGTITLADAARPIRTTADAIASGIGMVHQHFTNVPAMTVAENVALGARGRYSNTRATELVRRVGAASGLPLDPDARVAELPVGAQQRLEIVKALARDVRMLILDEPTAVLAPSEAEELLRWVRGFANAGNAIVLITHKLREALAVADDVTVLRRGRVVLTADAASLSADSLASVLVGDDEQTIEPTPTPTRAHSRVARLVAVDADDSRGVRALRSVDLEIRTGEIVGIAGVEGAGQRELLRLLAGRARPLSGDVSIPSSIGFIPEDRHRDAVVLDFSLAENVAVKGAGSRRGWVQWESFRERASELVRSFDIRGGSTAATARQLSGGNQQKLILARELDGDPLLVVAENPTRGLDVRAAAAVHARLRRASERGAAVVVYSSDLDEVLSLADRVMVAHAGRITECPRDREAVGRAMLGVA